MLLLLHMQSRSQIFYKERHKQQRFENVEVLIGSRFYILDRDSLTIEKATHD